MPRGKGIDARLADENAALLADMASAKRERRPRVPADAAELGSGAAAAAAGADVQYTYAPARSPWHAVLRATWQAAALAQFVRLFAPNLGFTMRPYAEDAAEWDALGGGPGGPGSGGGGTSASGHGRGAKARAGGHVHGSGHAHGSGHVHNSSSSHGHGGTHTPASGRKSGRTSPPRTGASSTASQSRATRGGSSTQSLADGTDSAGGGGGGDSDDDGAFFDPDLLESHLVDGAESPMLVDLVCKILQKLFHRNSISHKDYKYFVIRAYGRRAYAKHNPFNAILLHGVSIEEVRERGMAAFEGLSFEYNGALSSSAPVASQDATGAEQLDEASKIDNDTTVTTTTTTTTNITTTDNADASADANTADTENDAKHVVAKIKPEDAQPSPTKSISKASPRKEALPAASAPTSPSRKSAVNGVKSETLKEDDGQDHASVAAGSVTNNDDTPSEVTKSVTNGDADGYIMGDSMVSSQSLLSLTSSAVDKSGMENSVSVTGATSVTTKTGGGHGSSRERDFNQPLLNAADYWPMDALPSVFDLNPRDRVLVIYNLCEWLFEASARFRDPFQPVSTPQIEAEHAQWRIDPVGRDRRGGTYWLFDDYRLYYESPPPHRLLGLRTPSPAKPRPRRPKYSRSSPSRSPSGLHDGSEEIYPEDEDEDEEDVIIEYSASGYPRRRSKRKPNFFTSSSPPKTIAATRSKRRKTSSVSYAMPVYHFSSDEELDPDAIRETRPARQSARRANQQVAAQIERERLANRRLGVRLRMSTDQQELEEDEEADDDPQEVDEPRGRSRRGRSDNNRVASVRRTRGSSTAEKRVEDEKEEAVDDSDAVEQKEEDAETEQPASTEEGASSSLNDETGTAHPQNDATQSDTLAEELDATVLFPDMAAGPPGSQVVHNVPLPIRDPESGTTWHTVCISRDEWTEFPKRFEHSTDPAERDFFIFLTERALPRVLEHLDKKEERKRQELIELSRKRSSRLQMKEIERMEAEERMARERSAAKAAREAMRAAQEAVRNPNAPVGSDSPDSLLRQAVQRSRDDRLAERERRIREREERAVLEAVEAEKRVQEEAERKVQEERERKEREERERIEQEDKERKRQEKLARRRERDRQRRLELKMRNQQQQQAQQLHLHQPHLQPGGHFGLDSADVSSGSLPSSTSSKGKPKMPRRRAHPTVTQSGSATQEEWQFDCVCGLRGANIDDGFVMVCCEKCGVWAHLHCIANNGAPLTPELQQEWDKREYICASCRGVQPASPMQQQQQQQQQQPTIPQHSQPAQQYAYQQMYMQPAQQQQPFGMPAAFFPAPGSYATASPFPGQVYAFPGQMPPQTQPQPQQAYPAVAPGSGTTSPAFAPHPAMHMQVPQQMQPQQQQQPVTTPASTVYMAQPGIPPAPLQMQNAQPMQPQQHQQQQAGATNAVVGNTMMNQPSRH